MFALAKLNLLSFPCENAVLDVYCVFVIQDLVSNFLNNQSNMVAIGINKFFVYALNVKSWPHRAHLKKEKPAGEKLKSRLGNTDVL